MTKSTTLGARPCLPAQAQPKQQQLGQPTTIMLARCSAVSMTQVGGRPPRLRLRECALPTAFPVHGLCPQPLLGPRSTASSRSSSHLPRAEPVDRPAAQEQAGAGGEAPLSSLLSQAMRKPSSLGGSACAAVALALHCLMVSRGFTAVERAPAPTAAGRQRTITPYTPPTDWQQHGPNEWGFTYTHPEKVNNFVLIVSIQGDR